MLVITAPSKTQQQPKPPFPQACAPLTTPVFAEESALLNRQLQQLSREELATLMKLSDRLTATTTERINAFSLPFTEANSAPALLTFQGDAWEAIKAESYSREQLAHAGRTLRILSGLYGILRPLDLMQPYRLEMGLKFPAQRCSNLYGFWKERLTTHLLQELAKEGEGSLVNLASTEYSKAVDKKQLLAAGHRWLDITFQQPHTKSASGWKTIPIHSKRARGLMLHCIITEKISTVAELKEFSLGGYHFVEEESTAENWLFRRLEEGA